MSDKELMADIEQGKKDVAEGRVYTFDEALKELGIDEDELRVFFPKMLLNSRRFG